MVNDENEEGETPLHLAVLKGMSETVEWLLDHNANLYSADSCVLERHSYLCDCRGIMFADFCRTGDNALHFGVRAGRPEMVHLLLTRGLNPEICNKVGAPWDYHLRESLVTNTIEGTVSFESGKCVCVCVCVCERASGKWERERERGKWERTERGSLEREREGDTVTITFVDQ